MTCWVYLVLPWLELVKLLRFTVSGKGWVFLFFIVEVLALVIFSFFLIFFVFFSGSPLIIICSLETINQRQTRQGRYSSPSGVSIRNMCALRYRWTFRELLSTSLWLVSVGRLWPAPRFNILTTLNNHKQYKKTITIVKVTNMVERWQQLRSFLFQAFLPSLGRWVDHHLDILSPKTLPGSRTPWLPSINPHSLLPLPHTNNPG